MVIASAKRLASSYTPRGPIGFTCPQYVSRLRVDLRIAVYLGCRGENESRALGVRQTQRLVRSQSSDFEGSRWRYLR